MKIGELAQRSGLAASAIRYYERAGLLPKPSRGSNGYREYGEATVDQLRVIEVARNLGFTLEAIRVVLKLEGDALENGLMHALDALLAENDKAMLALTAQRASLLETARRLRESELTHDCIRPLARR
jgi:MerR family copper efflux transcriptional regulator